MPSTGKFRVGDLVIIHWQDAFTPHENGWATPHGYAKMSDLDVISVGFIAGSDRSKVCLCSGTYDSDDYAVMMCNPFYIPMGCIKSVGRIRHGEKATRNTKGKSKGGDKAPLAQKQGKGGGSKEGSLHLPDMRSKAIKGKGQGAGRRGTSR